MKRKDHFSWDETFMQMCKVIAQRSKDPNTQIGACIVDENNIIISFGYNGFPRGCRDDKLPWDREGDFVDTKYPYVVHAEANAVLNANTSTKNSKVYCNLFPCNECAKILIQAGVREVIYESDKYHDLEAYQASRRMFDLSGVKYRKYSTEHLLQFKKQKNG